MSKLSYTPAQQMAMNIIENFEWFRDNDGRSMPDGNTDIGAFNNWIQSPSAIRLIAELGGMPRWVSVDERLPDKYGYYSVKVIFVDTVYPDGCQYSIEHKRWGSGLDGNVIEWLDEPPTPVNEMIK